MDANHRKSSAMHRALLILLLFSLLPSPSIAAEDRIVLRLKPSSPSLDRWLDQGRSGSLPFLFSAIGEHDTEPFILDATLQAVETRRQRGMQVLTSLPTSRLTALRNTVVVMTRGPVDAAMAARKLSAHPDVDTAAVLPSETLCSEPNDPLFGQAYHHRLVRASDAWQLLPSQGESIIAIVDTGIDLDHPDLAPNIWYNSGEIGRDGANRDKRTNGVDDDRNGFVDDYVGWDFVSSSSSTGDNRPTPGNSHGTHVAGIAAAVSNNALGSAGIALRTKLMAIKVSQDEAASRSVTRTGDAILYAASMGAKIINCSFGSPQASFASADVIATATQLGALVVGAAGNDGVDAPLYPAAYDDAISVAATDQADVLAEFSNRHATVDIAAPGVRILSTIPNGSYGTISGTSMSAPVVAGVAAMVRLARPMATPDEIKAILVATADTIDGANLFAIGRFGSGRVNALEALRQQNAKRALVVEATLQDDVDDGTITPGERARLRIRIKNQLSPLVDARVDVRAIPGEVTPVVQTPAVSVGPLGTNDAKSLPSDILVDIPADAPLNGIMNLLVEISDGGVRAGRLLLTARVNTSYRTLTANDLALTVTSAGNLAYNDYPSNVQGDGCRLNGGPDMLFEASFMVAASPNHISNMGRTAQVGRKDTSFTALEIIRIKTDSVDAGIRATSSYDDRFERFAAGVSVRQHVYQSPADSVNQSVLLRFDVTNRTDTVLRNAYASLFMDWDIGPGGQANGCGWLGDAGIGIVENVERSDLPYVGVSMISPLATNYFALDNPVRSLDDIALYDGFTRTEKFITMSSGIARKSSRITDVSMVIGGGPFSLAPGETQQIVFVIAANSKVEALRNSIEAQRQRAKLLGLNAVDYVPVPDATKIIRIENGPVFLAGTVVDVTYQLEREAEATLDVVDIFGRTVGEPTQQPRLLPGTHKATFQLPQTSTGTYFVRCTVGPHVSVIPIQIAR
jgi:hypothetical protein